MFGKLRLFPHFDYIPYIKPPDLDLKINGINIGRVYECKFLGLIIDDKLNWKSHIKVIATKAAKTIGIINKAIYISRGQP